jgi:hypothetical protein
MYNQFVIDPNTKEQKNVGLSLQEGWSILYLRFKFDEFQPEQPSRNSVTEKRILFSISEDDRSVLLYPAKKLS